MVSSSGVEGPMSQGLQTYLQLPASIIERYHSLTLSGGLRI